MSTYIKVAWLHEYVDEPVMLYSELDLERYETRKVEVFGDGHMDWADPSRESGTTGLSEVAIPHLDEIGADPQFVPHEITAEEFEAVWTAAQNASIRHEGHHLPTVLGAQDRCTPLTCDHPVT